MVTLFTAVVFINTSVAKTFHIPSGNVNDSKLTVLCL